MVVTSRNLDHALIAAESSSNVYLSITLSAKSCFKIRRVLRNAEDFGKLTRRLIQIFIRSDIKNFNSYFYIASHPKTYLSKFCRPHSPSCVCKGRDSQRPDSSWKPPRKKPQDFTDLPYKSRAFPWGQSEWTVWFNFISAIISRSFFAFLQFKTDGIFLWKPWQSFRPCPRVKLPARQVVVQV